MANGNEKSRDFYSVLGLDKECTASDLRIAYKKLAMVSFLFLLYNLILLQILKIKIRERHNTTCMLFVLDFSFFYY